MASRPCPEWSKPAIYQGGCGWSGLCIRPGFAQGVSLHPRSLSDHVSWPSLDPPTDRWLWHCQLHFFRPTCTALITGPCRLRENGGQLSQALGHSRGGFSTKVIIPLLHGISQSGCRFHICRSELSRLDSPLTRTWASHRRGGSNGRHRSRNTLADDWHLPRGLPR